MKMTRAIAGYIRKKNKNAEEISKATGVKKEKLLEPVEQALDGEELLRVCAYLEISPEVFWQKVGK